MSTPKTSQVRYSARLSRRRVIVGAGAGLAIGASATALSSSPATAQPDTPVNAPIDSGKLIDIGNRFLYIESAGSGEPTVVLEAGALGRSDVWSRDLHQPFGQRQMVMPAIAEFSHVVAYDRPGTIGEVNPDLEPDGPDFYPSRSDPVSQPRTIVDIVADVHALLAAASIPPPYVLVGHSMGGMAMRLYANTYADEVVGMVLVDATPEDIYVEFAKALPADVWSEFDILNSGENSELLAVYPEYERIFRAPLLDDPNGSILREAQAANPLHPMPLVVLAHAIPFAAPMPEWPTATMEGIMFEQQQRQAELVPNARFIVAEQSGHNIHQDQPELVIAAIRAVVDAVQDPSTW